MSPPASLQPGASRRSTASVCKSITITNPPGHRATRSQRDVWANHCAMGQGPVGTLVQVPPQITASEALQGPS